VGISELVGLRVLIVEDEPLIALCLDELVSEWGCTVAGSTDKVGKALEFVATKPFDIAILDLSLHGQSVEPVAAAVVAAGRVIVFASGADHTSVSPEFRHFPSISKPYPDDQLLAALIQAASALQEMVSAA
jgi:CheY-like chemotaxis protein